MKYCEHCNVYIKGEQENCSLCGNIIPANDNIAGEDIYPSIPPSYEKHLAIRILIFISIATIVVSSAINFIFPTNINNPILIIFGLLSIWLGLISIVQKRHHIPKKIVRQVVIVSILALFWDWKTGWRGWSLDYVIPIACVAAMVIMYVTAKIMKLSIRDYITYSLIDGIFGIIPVLFILFGWIKVLYPSIISIALSVISLSSIFIFQGKDIKMEMDKRMHI